MSGSDRKSGKAEDCAREAEVSLGSFIARTAIRTLIVFLVFFSLAAALIGCFFPKLYMDLYRSVGAYGKAAAYASAAVGRERGGHAADCDGKCAYASLLTDGLGLSELAYDVASTEAHALMIYEFADEYLAASCHEAHSSIVDRKYLAACGEDYASLSALYGYDDYVCGERTRSACLLGGEYYAAATDYVGGELAAVRSGSGAPSRLLDVLTAYTDSAAKTDGVQYAALADGQAYLTLCGYYFGYAEAADGADIETDGRIDAAKVALKGSLLRRIGALAANLANVENVFASYADTYFKDKPELNALVAKDVFGAEETVRARRAYTDFIGSLKSK